MAKDPAFLFYSQDFIVGVQTMSFEDRGKYITILAQMHQQGRLDEETILFIVGTLSVGLKRKFMVDENGLWYNVRLEYETKKRNNFTESRRNNGIKGGRPLNNKQTIHKNTNNHMDNLMGNEIEIDNDIIIKDNKKERGVGKEGKEEPQSVIYLTKEIVKEEFAHADKWKEETLMSFKSFGLTREDLDQEISLFVDEQSQMTNASPGEGFNRTFNKIQLHLWRIIKNKMQNGKAGTNNKSKQRNPSDCFIASYGDDKEDWGTE